MTVPVKGQFHPFPGGIHPPENKHQSLREPIRKPALPDRLIVPLTQPGFLAPELCVEPGQHVRGGEVIARGTPNMGITVHAPTSGTITAIREHTVPNASGIAELCAILDTDGRDERSVLPPLDPAGCDGETLVKRINDCGINGLGGAGFPTHTKLLGALKKVHTLVMNAAECEPFITADDALMRERAGEIVTGIGILLDLVSPQRCLIGIEDNKPEAIDAMQAAIDAAGDARITMVVVPTKYPSGAEKQLIYLLTGVEIPSGAITLSSGILCQNVGTAYAIKRAVLDGEALTSRIVTLTGAALKRPGNLEALIGTPVVDLLRECEVDGTQLSRLINGGPLMGLQLPHADLPVLKITNCIIATTDAEMPPPVPAQACIRCGFCAEVCPVSLLPQQLYWFARGKEHDKAEEHNLFDCIECGACAYVCPSHIPLVQYYRAAKGEIRQEKDKHRMAEHSRERFEFHQARKEEEKRLEEQRRAERAALAKKRKAEAAAGSDDAGQPDDAKAAIAAAMERVKAKKAAKAAAAAQTPAASSDQADGGKQNNPDETS